MSILSDEDREIIKSEYFDRMTGKVEIYFFSSEKSKYNEVIRELLRELADITEKITVSELKFESSSEIHGKFGVNYAPCIVLSSEVGKLKYYGVPAGQEFPSFLKAIVMVSTGEIKLEEGLDEFLRKIDKPVEIKVFVTLTCPYCPIMVETAYKFALKSNNVDVEVIEAEEFLEEARRYRVHAVPKVVVNEKVSFEGAIPPNAFAEYIERAVEA